MKSRHTFGGLVVVAALALGAVAHSQTSAVSSTLPACPHRSLSVYFSSGDSMVSEQAKALTTRIGEAAAACEPDQIDLVARVDGVEGAAAITLALERLAQVARELVAAGLPADRIRAVARPIETGHGGLHQVDIVFRKQDGALDSGETGKVEPTILYIPHRGGDAI